MQPQSQPGTISSTHSIVILNAVKDLRLPFRLRRGFTSGLPKTRLESADERTGLRQLPMLVSTSRATMTGMVFNHAKGAWLAVLVCCFGVVATGLSIESFAYSLSIAAIFCVGLLAYEVSVCRPRIGAAWLLFLNSALLVAIFVPLRVGLDKSFRHFPLFSVWPHRIYRVWWLSECAAIIVALMALGVLAIEVVGSITGETSRKRFRWCLTVAASILVAVNVDSLLQPLWCVDCFFPYGVPFTFYTEGGYGGGGGFVWLGVLGDVALVLAFATGCTLLWNQIAKYMLISRKRTH